MDRISERISMRAPLAVVVVCVMLYSSLFTYMSVRRMNLLWASYFDLGIMHHTVYNTYHAVKTGDMSRVMELTDPHGSGQQIKRMAIHHDILLVLLFPLYYIHSGPETLLILQSVVISSGALALYFIMRHALSHAKMTRGMLNILCVGVPLAYLLYPSLQRSNLYEFHAVTLSTALTLWMYLAYKTRRYIWCALLVMLILASKEQAGFGLGVFFIVEAVRLWWQPIRTSSRMIASHLSHVKVLLGVGVACIAVVFLLVYVVMPSYRGGAGHFALSYFDSPSPHILGAISTYLSRLSSTRTLSYIGHIVGPVSLLPLGSFYILPAVPDLLINILSSNWTMQTINYHYTSLITPWIFIGVVDIVTRLVILKRMAIVRIIGIVLIFSTVFFSWSMGSMPYSYGFNPQIFYGSSADLDKVISWNKMLARDDIPVSSTGHLAPFLTSRRYFYDFGEQYDKADYILLQKSEVYGYWIKGKLIPYYQNLVKDKRYTLIYINDDFEVYKRVLSTD